MQIAITTRTLHECAKLCFEYILCYSVTFDRAQKKPCIFYLHASKQCSQKILTPIDEIKESESVTIECLKCMDDEVISKG